MISGAAPSKWLASIQCAVVLAALATVTFASAQAPTPTAGEPPLSNADVVKLCKLGLGDEVVIAKIIQATIVEFRLDLDSLVQLKEQGASKAVIEAMLKRASPPPAQAAHAGSRGAVPADAATAGDEGVLLRTSQGEVRLQSVQGDLSTVSAYVVTLMFLDFPGLRADVRITDRRPTLVVRSTKSPRGRVFLVKCEGDEDDNNRSVKLGRARLFGAKSWSSPDSDWTVEFDAKEVSSSTWEIAPKQDLRPGEHGLLFRGGLGGILGPTQGELFDFGVD